MGSLILCNNKKAQHPYEITRIHMPVYTIEELCYYICNYLYLVDDTLINRQLCDWLSEELQMETLARELKCILRKHGPFEKLILTILKGSGIYKTSELVKVQDIMQQLKNEKEVERWKYKADNLLRNNETETAISIYLSILHEEKDDTLNSKFYGRVYGCLGTAYGRLFLYEEAASCYHFAFQICEDPEMLKAYLYCCYRYMKKEDFEELLMQNESYQKVFSMLCITLQEKFEESQREVLPFSGQQILEQYKEYYRRTI